MKLHAGTHTVEKSGDFEESKFSIEASSKAFFILSDGLYSNKILAVIRELSTNAYDSHVEAGKKDVAFDAHIPTQLNPVFFIRDYGTSMSHEACMQLYTTYFRSTRNNSNDAVGCLGLGSKAPFAYADSFTVEAFMNGKCRVYNAHKDNNGSPVFSLMNEFDTQEPDGIKVSLNVNSNDISRFQHEAKKVYEFFKVKPNFVAFKPQFNTLNKVLEGDSWYFDDNADNNLIVMGQIAYPIDFSQFAAINNKARQFVEYSDGLRIFVNIGDVDITPSRESLSYSAETKDNILRIITQIMDEIAVKIETEIGSQTTLFKARSKYVQISSQCSSIRSAVESLQKSITWKEHKLFDSVAGEYIDVKNSGINSLEKSGYRSKIDVKHNIERLHFNYNAKFMVDDLTRGGISRIKQYMKENSGSQVIYVYKIPDGQTVDTCSFYDILGGATKDDIVFTSSLPKIEYNRSSSGGSSGCGLPPVQAMVFNEESGRFEDCSMSVKYENAHYFIESKGSVSFGNTYADQRWVEHMLSYIHANHADKIGDASFYLVKPSVAKNRKLSERTNWHNGNSVISKIIHEAFESNKHNIIAVSRRSPLSNERHDKWVDIIKMTETDNEVKAICMEYEEYDSMIDSMSDEMTKISTAAKQFGINTIDWSVHKTDNNRFAVRFDNAMKRYPMLKLLGHVWNETDKKMVADYIDSLENGFKAQKVLSSI